MDNEKGTFYIVATPIGNMGDITFRAVETLQNVDEVYAEDTREFAKIKERYSINTPSHSYNAHSTEKKHHEIVNKLLSGKNIALVSDAGTPGISDPGVMIVHLLRSTYPEIPIVPIPGVSAVTTLFSVSGIVGNQFVFLGFPPHKKGREKFFKEVLTSSVPAIFYESCHRIVNAISSIEKTNPQKSILIGRELTKKFETIISGTPIEIIDYLQKSNLHTKGEFTVIVY